jgi:hypothetical protein
MKLKLSTTSLQIFKYRKIQRNTHKRKRILRDLQKNIDQGHLKTKIDQDAKTKDLETINKEIIILKERVKIGRKRGVLDLKTKSQTVKREIPGHPKEKENKRGLTEILKII